MRGQSFFFRFKLHHIIPWMFVFGLWYYLRYQDYAPGDGFWITLVKVADLALLIYIANYLLIPRLLYRKRYGWFILVFVLMIVTSSIIKMQIIGYILDRPGLFDLSTRLKQRVYDNVIPHFFLVTAGVALKLIYDYSQMQKRLTEMAREKAEAELSFLKSQINPHFLFNSLNSVYFLISRDNVEARTALHKFSDMLRYQLYEANGERIPIEKEIRYLADYIDLQRLRKDENYVVAFHCDADVKDFSIEPLLLIPFVENAFKHISHRADQPNTIEVNLSIDRARFHFHVANSKEQGRTTELHGGIGLNNVRRRLELLYPGQHELSIMNSESSFTVDLWISLSPEKNTPVVLNQVNIAP